MNEEHERLAMLHEYGLLDAPADAELEAVVRVAALVAGVPTATLNLIDENRQCQLTTTGFEGGDSARDDSMCAARLPEKRTIVVPDARQDPVYRDNPWVTGRLAGVRFYASVPLVTPSGYALGTLCVFDDVPGDLDERQVARLEDLARVIMALFERRRETRHRADLAAEADKQAGEADKQATEAEKQRAVAQRALREAEIRQQLLDAVLDSVDVAIVAADPVGRLSLFNRAAAEWHGLDADGTIDPDDFSDAYALFETDGVTPLALDHIPLLRALRDGAVDHAEILIRPPARAPRWVTATGRRMTGADGIPLGAVVAMTDVSADRAHRAEMEAAHAALNATVAELERSNAELTNFAAVAGHDLASPLAVVSGYLELLTDLRGADLDEQALGWVNTAARAVARMQGLIQALLTYARAGNAPTACLPTDLSEVLGHAMVDLRTPIKDNHATVRTPAPLPSASCDPTLIRQLLQNLVGNSIKYRHPDRSPTITVTGEVTDDGVLVRVADNGIGIPPEHRERAFDMFAMVEPAKRTGHGIGLSTCLRIVQRHGGAIRAEETPGGGTTIVFTLPRTPR
ncbi:signal transduction histidine kinase [Catenuloplanes nepalensis]|uniref:histidine kinase n=1 Tax=Catenuloplanes nepalensis TaxID=587533 RepID=A0ABT9MTK1_9ACTN|nr:ATP-binding protein [Catenuloplanes nepalensis]MDP9794770.1 signal transduction histidine kinase [Catenuloplanes nepalensis]